METDSTLIPLGPDIWIADGPAISFYGLPFPTRMTVVRLSNGDLFLHSPIAHSEDLENELRRLGNIRHLVSPNWIHYAYIPEWTRRIAGSISWASPGVRERAESKGVSIEFDRNLEDEAPVDWFEELSQMIVHGSSAHTEVVFMHHSSKTLILTDLIENMDRKQFPIWIRPLLALGGVVAPNGKLPLDMWFTFRRGRETLSKALGQMLAWNPEIVVLAHGDILRENVPQRLRAGFRNLAPLRPEPE